MLRVEGPDPGIRDLEKQKPGNWSQYRLDSKALIVCLLPYRHLPGHCAGEECLLELEFGSRERHGHRQGVSARGIKPLPRIPGPYSHLGPSEGPIKQDFEDVPCSLVILRGNNACSEIMLTFCICQPFITLKYPRGTS